MATAEKIEGYMINLGVTFQQINESTWLINDAEKGLEQVVVAAEEPLVIFRVKVMPIPSKRREEFFERLLRLNASDLLHGAYGLSDNYVVLIQTLEYATMDLEEFQASLEAIGLALTQHYPVLSDYRDKDK